MIPLVLLCLLIGVPVLFALILRVNAVFLFLSLAVGDMLVRYLSDDVILAVNAFVRAEAVPMIVRLVLLLGPVLVSLLVLRKSMPSSKIFLQIVTLLAIGLAVASLTIPIMPHGLQTGIFSLPAGDVLRQSQDIIIAVAAILSLLLALSSHRHNIKRHGKKR